jgi:hypothetical protein
VATNIHSVVLFVVQLSILLVHIILHVYVFHRYDTEFVIAVHHGLPVDAVIKSIDAGEALNHSKRNCPLPHSDVIDCHRVSVLVSNDIYLSTHVFPVWIFITDHSSL